MSGPLLWVHEDALDGGSPLFEQYPGRPAVFVFDDGVVRERHYGFKRIGFIYECLLELPVEIHRGDAEAILARRRRETGSDSMLAMRTPCPILTELGERAGVAWLDGPPFVRLDREPDLRRFSRYWQTAARSAMQPTDAPYDSRRIGMKTKPSRRSSGPADTKPKRS